MGISDLFVLVWFFSPHFGIGMAKALRLDLFQHCFLKRHNLFSGLPWWLNGKESTCQYRRHRFDPWSGKIPWRRKWQPTPAFLQGNPMDRGAWQTTQSMGSRKSQAQLDDNLFSSFTGIEMDKYVVLRWVICRVSLSDLDNANNQILDF